MFAWLFHKETPRHIAEAHAVSTDELMREAKCRVARLQCRRKACNDQLIAFARAGNIDAARMAAHEIAVFDKGVTAELAVITRLTQSGIKVNAISTRVYTIQNEVAAVRSTTRILKGAPGRNTLGAATSEAETNREIVEELVDGQAEIQAETSAIYRDVSRMPPDDTDDGDEAGSENVSEAAHRIFASVYGSMPIHVRDMFTSDEQMHACPKVPGSAIKILPAITAVKVYPT